MGGYHVIFLPAFQFQYHPTIDLKSDVFSQVWYLEININVQKSLWHFPLAWKSNIASHHYIGIIIGMIASQITSLTIVYSTVYSDADQRKHQSSASLAYVRGIHRRPLNSLHKWPVTRKMFPFDDVMMWCFDFNTTSIWHLYGCCYRVLFHLFLNKIK